MSPTEKDSSSPAAITTAAPVNVESDKIEDYLPDWGTPWWKTKHLVLLNLSFVCPLLSSSTNGYDGSMLNGLQSLPQWQDFFNSPTGAILGALANGAVLGGVLGALAASWISDRWGRRMGIFSGSFIIIIGAILQCAAVNYAMFLVSRLILGFGSLIAIVASPSLVSETAYPTHRASMTAVYNTLWYLGALIAAWVTYGTYFMTNSSWSWRMPSLLQGLIPLIQCLTVYFVPESPRFLVNKGRYEEARKVLLKWHAGGNEQLGGRLVDFEMAEISSAIEHEKIQSETSYLEFIRTKPNRHRLAIITLMAICMQLCGNGLVSYYLHYVLNSIGITDASEQLIINGGLMVYNLGVSIITAVIASRLPRRKVFLYGMFTMLLCFIVWTVLSAFNQKENFKNKSLGQGVLAMIFLFYASYNMCLNGLPVLYVTEVMPYYLRAKGIGWFNLVTQVVLIYNGFVNPVAMEAIDWKYYIVYCCLIAVELIGVFFLFPETKGYTLEEVAEVFGDPTVVDVGTQIREKREGHTEHVEKV